MMNSRFDRDGICLHLRAKQMYYEDIVEEEHRRDVESTGAASDTTAYWCERTQTGRGPDERPVNLESCGQPGRKCFECVLIPDLTRAPGDREEAEPQAG